MSLTIEQGADIMRRLRTAIAARIVGQDAAIDDALITFLARGHLLVEGVPGTAKTLLVRTLASALAVRFTRVQFTPDLMPSDLTGIAMLRDASRNMAIPVKSLGMRSGVNCTRVNRTASALASVRTSSVLAVPGTPSTSR